MTATLDRVSNGRLLVNVVTGGDPVENKGDGIFLDHDERYVVTREFLSVYSDLLAGKTVDLEGKHIHIEDGRLLFPPVQSPRPPLFFGGSSEGARCRGRAVDKYLTWGEPPARSPRRSPRWAAAANADASSSSVSACMSSCAKPMRRPGTPPAIDLAPRPTRPSPRRRRYFSRMDSIGQRRMAQLHGGRQDRSRSARTCGRAWASCAAAPVRRWWAIPHTWPTASRNTRTSA